MKGSLVMVNITLPIYTAMQHGQLCKCSNSIFFDDFG